MLRSIKTLQGYQVRAQGKAVGSIKDFYFDDKAWIIRYLVVDVMLPLTARKILLSPASVTSVESQEQALAINLSHDEIESSPDFDDNKPISRQMETALTQHYDWPMYWKNSGLLLDSNVLMDPQIMQAAAEAGREEADAHEQADVDPHLRSMDEVLGYYLQARDGEAGRIEDLIVGDNSWRVNYVVVDTGNWLPGRQVLISPTWIEQVKWLDAEVQIDLTRETIENSPEYEPSVIFSGTSEV